MCAVAELVETGIESNGTLCQRVQLSMKVVKHVMKFVELLEEICILLPEGDAPLEMVVLDVLNTRYVLG